MKSRADAHHDGSPSSPRLATFWRFNPQVLVFLAGLACAWPAIVGLVVTGVHVIWGSSFRQADYTMLEARSNEGWPYITGTLDETGETLLVPARQDGERFLIGEKGDAAFVPNRKIKVWWSPSAPDLQIEGRRTNVIPVSALPERPGVIAMTGYAAWLIVVVLITVKLCLWAVTRMRIGGRVAGVGTGE